MLKRITFLLSISSKKQLGKISGAVMQNRSDAIKHILNAKTRVYIIILFHVLQFYCDYIPSVLSLTELIMRREGAGDRIISYG